MSEQTKERIAALEKELARTEAHARNVRRTLDELRAAAERT